MDNENVVDISEDERENKDFIDVSSSEEDDNDDERDEEREDEEDEEDEDDDEDENDESSDFDPADELDSASVSENDEGDSVEDDENDEDEKSCNDIKKEKQTEKDHYAKAFRVLKGRGDLSQLKLDDCKAYLRKHGLILSGNKSVCIQRMKEHMEIAAKGAQTLYPRTSFTISCKGDVCAGDVVLFSQRVYQRYDVASRGRVRTPLGKRTVAGRVIKESYGKAKQQHTFTVEVLWSVGVKPLAPLHLLLIKGRNLYRMRISRQPWKDESERAKVLAEKHQRGSVARSIRAAARRNKRPSTQMAAEPSTKRRKTEKLESCKGSQKSFPDRGDLEKKPQYPPIEKSFQRNYGIRQSAKENVSGINPTGKSHVIPNVRSGPVQQHVNFFQRDGPILQRHLINMEAQNPRVSYARDNNLHASSIARPSANYNFNPHPPLLPVHNFHSGPSTFHSFRKSIAYPYQTVFPGMHQDHTGRSSLSRHLCIPTTVPNTQSSLNCSFHGCNDRRAKDCVNGACGQCCRRTRTTCRRHRTH